MSDSTQQQFAKDDDPPCFSDAPTRPEFEQNSIPQHASSMTIIAIIDRQSYGCVKPVEPPPRDFLVLSCFTFWFCIWPLGLAAMVASFETKNKLVDGDVEGARRSSIKALRYIILSILFGIPVYTLFSLYVAGISIRCKIDAYRKQHQRKDWPLKIHQ
ncbi:uncharacterized protein [Argopecten irradians]